MQQQQQQRAQQPQQPSLPAEVNILAVQNQLGTWKAEYRARLAVLNARTVLVLSLVGILGGAGLVISDYLLHGAFSVSFCCVEDYGLPSTHCSTTVCTSTSLPKGWYASRGTQPT